MHIIIIEIKYLLLRFFRSYIGEILYFTAFSNLLIPSKYIAEIDIYNKIKYNFLLNKFFKYT